MLAVESGHLHMDENDLRTLEDWVDVVHVIHSHLGTCLDETEQRLANHLLDSTVLLALLAIPAPYRQVCQILQYLGVIQDGVVESWYVFNQPQILVEVWWTPPDVAYHLHYFLAIRVILLLLRLLRFFKHCFPLLSKYLINFLSSDALPKDISFELQGVLHFEY